MRTTGAERKSDRDFFGSLRNGIADEPEETYNCEKDRDATEQTDDRRDLFYLGHILPEARGERDNRWVEPSVDAAGNRLNRWGEGIWISRRPDQYGH